MEMKNALLSRQLDRFGRLLDEAWQAKQRMSPRISNDHIADLYKAAKANGAIGGKITGAGGGGYMLLYCDGESRHRVAHALTERGAVVEDIAFEPRGMQTWRVDAER